MWELLCEFIFSLLTDLTVDAEEYPRFAAWLSSFRLAVITTFLIIPAVILAIFFAIVALGSLALWLIS